MPTTLEEHAVEQSTFVIQGGFTDYNGDAVVPNELTWTLTDPSGEIINSREDEVLTPAAAVNIVLHGDDLAIGQHGTKRIITVQGTYDSDLGSDLEIRDEVTFYIDNLTHIS